MEHTDSTIHGSWCDSRLRRRGRDRRPTLGQLLEALTPPLATPQPTALWRAFENALQLLFPARDARIRSVPRSYGQTSGSHAQFCIEIRAPADNGRVVLLDATGDPSVPLDRWERELLESAARVAALVLEAERARGLVRVGQGRGALQRESPALIGTSQPMNKLRDQIARVAATDFTVLIEGESGTGKELVARLIHDQSQRSSGPFVAVNCAAVVETLLEAELFGIEERTATGVRGRRGKFENANGGTLFLDEVSDLSASAQAKLLRALQDLCVERVGGRGSLRVDTRIVVATNRSLREMVDHGQFRLDLHYRLSGVEVRVPPLRARREDIPELVEHFLDRHRPSRTLEFSQPAMDALLTYTWAGNVRELERLVERLIALVEGNVVQLEDLPSAIHGSYADVLLPSLTEGETLRAWGSRYARLVLERCGQNKRKACKVLDISYHTLQAYLRYGSPPLALPPAPTWVHEKPLDGGEGDIDDYS